MNPYSADGSSKGSSIERYMNIASDVFEKAGYTSRVGTNLEGWMKEAGFTNVHAKKLVLPLGTWPKDKNYVRAPSTFASKRSYHFWYLTTQPYRNVLELST